MTQSRFLLFLALAAALLSALACTREILKEVEVPGETVVVEKEVVREVIVEKPVIVEREVVREIIKEVEVTGPGGETVLTMGLNALTPSFCPWPGGTGVFHFWEALMFPALAMPDGPNVEWSANLAERWDIAPDGSSYTFYLQPDAVWTDGMPITAEDVAYSFRLWLDPDSSHRHRAADEHQGRKGVPRG